MEHSTAIGLHIKEFSLRFPVHPCRAHLRRYARHPKNVWHGCLISLLSVLSVHTFKIYRPRPKNMGTIPRFRSVVPYLVRV